MEELTLRPIVAGDDVAMAAIIRRVMTEHGASGAGFAIHDAEVDGMFAAYQGERARYFVVVDGDRVVGGGGIAPLGGGPEDTCELRKMYFLPEVRGRGAGRRLLARCLDEARGLGFRRCYLETLATMDRAQQLYRAFGFAPLAAPCGATGHFGCDKWYALDLSEREA